MNPLAPQNMIPPHRLIEAYGHNRSKALGQHFLKDRSVLERIVVATGLMPGETILEIGPGPGVLTCQLLATGARVIAIEKDRRAAAFLKNQLPAMLGGEAADRLVVIEGDALEVGLQEAFAGHGGQEPLRAAGNLPYNVGTAILMRLLEAGFSECVLMFQREVARRLSSAPGKRSYGSLSLAVQARADAKILMEVEPEAFSPAPKVHSSVVQFRVPASPRVPSQERELFERAARAAFSTRRKTIRNSLKKALKGITVEELDAALEAAEIPARWRAEVVSLEKFLALSKHLEPWL